MTKIPDQNVTSTQDVKGINDQKRPGTVNGNDKDLEKKAKEFSEKLSEKKKSNTNTGKQRYEENMPIGTPGSMILKSMQTPNLGKETSPGMQNIKLSEAVNEIVDKMLVSESTLTSKNEIRLTLRESVMPGTEVRISNEKGTVNIELVTNSEHSYKLLSGETGLLEKTLKGRLNDTVSVEVRFNESSREDSRGRSRQQRNIYEEMEDGE